MRKGFISFVVILAVAAGAMLALSTLGWLKPVQAPAPPKSSAPTPARFGPTGSKDSPNLGTATQSGNFPTSTNEFQDGDVINAGDWNQIEHALGTRNSTDTSSLSYQLRSPTSTDPGHKHSDSSISGAIGPTHGGTGATSTPSLGSILVGKDGTQYGILAIGANGQCLLSSSTAPLGAAYGSCTPDGTFASTQPTSPTPKIGLNSYPSSTSFAYTGASASWTLPSNATGTITFRLVGAGGANGSGGGGGASGATTGTVQIAGGTVIYFAIGGASGFPNGGSGNGTGGVGGGMTWISTSTTFSTSTVLAVAGGGGGGAGVGAAGGSGGGTSGVAGVGGSNPGSGGTQSAGGAAGGTASPGTEGNGGAGSSNGGGGGGGYFGGGGGQTSGGGGGSGFISPSLTNATTTAAAGGGGASNGSINVSYSLMPATVSGNNFGGTITVVSSTSALILNFGTTFTNPVGCTAFSSRNIPVYGSNTTAAFTINASGTWQAADTINYTCL